MKLIDFFRSKEAGARQKQPRAMASEVGYFSGLNDPRLLEVIRGGGSMSGAGVAVTAEAALSVAAVWRCVSIIANSVASLPLHLMSEDRRDPRVKIKATGHPLFSVLYAAPNGWQSSFEFRNAMMMNVLLFGNAYAYKVMGSDGNVRQLIPIRADMVEVHQRDDFMLEYIERRDKGGSRKYAQDEIFHLRDISITGLSGDPRLRRMRNAIGLAIQTELFGSSLFANGANPGSAFCHPGAISAEAFERLKSSVEEHVGAGRANKNIILEEGIQFKPLGMTNEDSQFIDTRRFQISEIAMFFGVPPHMLGDTKATTSWGTGIEQQNIGYLQYTVGPWITAWEQAIIRDLILLRDRGSIYPKFNVSGLLRSSASDRAAYFSAALGSGGSPGWMTPNEVRALEELPPIEGGDSLPNTAPAAAAMKLKTVA
ncbi:MAG TPA: phage portal protein [Alphaproteobacteria bacterium]|nr:phage portal protein [Alphaproteobacteria bacterium]